MRRRLKGRGGITVKRDGRVQGTYVGSDGRMHYIMGPPGSRRDVEARLDEAVRMRDAGVFVAGPSQTTGAYLAAWLAHVTPTLRPRTVQRYESLIRIQAAPIASVPLRKLSAQHLAELYTAVRDRLSPASVAQLHAVLHSALGQAVEWGSIARNPAEAHRPPRVERQAMRLLSVPEIRVLLEAVRGDELEALYVLALTTGLRQGELLALRWRDVDLESGRVDVNATLTRIGGSWSRTPPKSAAGVRSVALTARGLAALRGHRIRMAERLLPFRKRTEDEVLVFVTQLGEPYNGFHITERAFKPLLRRAGLPEVRFHDLRHAFASLMLSEGVRVDLVSRMLGHSTPALTLNIYAHLMPGDQEEAMRRLDEALGS